MTAAQKSRQKQWQEAQRKAGRCTICGKEPIAAGSKSMGKVCLERRREKQRARGRWKPWVKGGNGRPPVGSEAKGRRKEMPV